VIARGRSRTIFDAWRLVGSFAILPSMLVLLASCTPVTMPAAPDALPEPVERPTVETAMAAGVQPGPVLASLGITPEAAVRGLGAFRISCPALLKRSDGSGLTRPEDWSAACQAAAQWPDEKAADFFAAQFETVSVGDGKAFATGYFEPRIAGSRTRAPGYDVPVYSVPQDLIEADLGGFADDLKDRRVRGRVQDRKFVPYFDRSEIEDGALAGRGIELAWAADPIDLFFLEIQGSGQLLLPDGGVMRIGYAGQNGRTYVPVGRLLKERNLTSGPFTMQAIKVWLRANPAQGRAIMRENKSYIFFTELTGAGPLGALGKPVTPRATVAADPKFVPLGAPIFLTADRAEANGLWIAQDTGGAIKGANRFDTFWGAGEDAALIAGGMSAKGSAVLLLPKGTLARLAQADDGAQIGK